MFTLDRNAYSVAIECPLCLFAFLGLTSSFLPCAHAISCVSTCEVRGGLWIVDAELRPKPSPLKAKSWLGHLASHPTALVTGQQSSWDVPTVGTKAPKWVFFSRHWGNSCCYFGVEWKVQKQTRATTGIGTWQETLTNPWGSMSWD